MSSFDSSTMTCITRSPGKGSKNSRKLLPRSEWRFQAEFSDGSTKWMLWPEANKMAALDEYAAQCKLKLPPG